MFFLAASEILASRKKSIKISNFENDFVIDSIKITGTKSFKKLSSKRYNSIPSSEGINYSCLDSTLNINTTSLYISRALQLNHDLINAISLGSNLGIAPFGILGSMALNHIMNGCFWDNKDICKYLSNEGMGFSVYEQNLRIVNDNDENLNDTLNLTNLVQYGLYYSRPHKNIVCNEGSFEGNFKLSSIKGKVSFAEDDFQLLEKTLIQNNILNTEGQLTQFYIRNNQDFDFSFLPDSLFLHKTFVANHLNTHIHKANCSLLQGQECRKKRLSLQQTFYDQMPKVNEKSWTLESLVVSNSTQIEEMKVLILDLFEDNNNFGEELLKYFNQYFKNILNKNNKTFLSKLLNSTDQIGINKIYQFIDQVFINDLIENSLSNFKMLFEQEQISLPENNLSYRSQLTNLIDINKLICFNKQTSKVFIELKDWLTFRLWSTQKYQYNKDKVYKIYFKVFNRFLENPLLLPDSCIISFMKNYLNQTEFKNALKSDSFNFRKLFSRINSEQRNHEFNKYLARTISDNLADLTDNQLIELQN